MTKTFKHFESKTKVEIDKQKKPKRKDNDNKKKLMKMNTIGASLAKNLASIPETKRELLSSAINFSDISPVKSSRSPRK